MVNESKLSKYDFVGECKKYLNNMKHYEEILEAVQNGTFVKKEEYVYED